jgi:mediator of RNA polymerase II transcription subunit 5
MYAAFPCSCIVANILSDLLEPFLVPCLVGAVHWMINHVWRQYLGDTAFTTQLLSRIVVPPSEPTTMHRTVLAIVADPLNRYLQKFKSGGKATPPLEKLFTALKPHCEYRKTIYHPCPELQSWIVAPGSLKQAFHSTFQSLISWSASAGINPIQGPSSYTHRQLHITLSIIGASNVLSILLEEIKNQTSDPQGAAAIAVDIATALICVPTPGSSLAPTNWMYTSRGGRMALREALRLEVDEAAKLMQTDAVLAETVVRLHRRVEAQLTVSAIALPAQIMPDLDAIGVDAAVAVAAVTDAMDFTTAGGGSGTSGLDLDLSNDTGMGGMDLTGTDGTGGGMDLLGTGSAMNGADDDDIFAGLDLGGDLDLDGGEW